MSLSISNIQFSYGKVPVLRDINFEVKAGHFCALLGPNGSGKSTLTKVLARIHSPRDGRVFLGETNLLRLPRRQAAKLVSYVPQNSEIPFQLSVRDAVLLGRTPHFGVRPRKLDHDIVETSIRRLNLTDLAERSVSSLSGGQAQRVLIARALAQEPTVLLLDEPTSALDLRYQVETLQLVREVTAERGIAALMAIHDLSHAAFFCDQIVLLKDGVIVADGSPTEALESSLVSDVYSLDIRVDHGLSRSDIRPGIFDGGRLSRTAPPHQLRAYA